MGISSDVRLAAWMPARRATSSGLPLGLEGKAASTAAESSTKADAVAERRVDCLALMSTMEASPDASKCESCGDSDMGSSFVDGLRFEVSRPGEKDKNVARMGHPEFLRTGSCSRQQDAHDCAGF